MNPNFVLSGDEFDGDADIARTSDRIHVTKLTVLPILPSFSYTLNF